MSLFFFTHTFQIRLHSARFAYEMQDSVKPSCYRILNFYKTLISNLKLETNFLEKEILGFLIFRSC
jgi:hypothetical protein